MADFRKIKNGNEYTRVYSGFRGVDRNGNGSDIAECRLAYLENLYRDYEGENSGVLESIPGFRNLKSFGSAINSIFVQCTREGEEMLLIHAGTSLYRIPIKDKDNIGSPVSIGTLKNVKSRGFSVKSSFFILDGDAIHKIDSDGKFETVKSETEDVYVPTRYVNGMEYEQRNLLTDSFYEEYSISDAYEYSYGTPELHYSVIDPELLYCAVSGIDDGFVGAVYVPRQITLSGKSYSVKKIHNSAFDGHSGITYVRIADGVEIIGKHAFRSCTSLTGAVIPESVREIGAGAFSKCTSLYEFFLGRGVEKLGLLLFDGSTKLSFIHYAGDDGDFEEIINTSAIGERDVVFNSEDTAVQIELPITDCAVSIEEVRVDGELFHHKTLNEGETVKSASLMLDTPRGISGKTVRIKGTLAPYSSSFTGRSGEFQQTEDGRLVGGFDAISKSTVSEAFDGRIFLSGNPSLPNTVFFTERDRTGENNPLYFGAMNYFCDGTGGYPINSILAVRDTLAVFKSRDDGSGSIFYHSPLSTGDGVVPRVYPVSYTHSGICSYGASLSFFDDHVFLSPMGLSALEHKSINQERNIGYRSHNINPDLLKEDLSEACLCEWLGYLAVCINGKIFLADSRSTFIHETQNKEYEWFFLNGIGTYQKDKRRYVYASVAPPGFSVHPNKDMPCNEVVYTVVNGTSLIFYTSEGGVNYCVSPSDEWTGGEFSAAKVFQSHGKLMFFGTDSGDLCVFNNDKRGVPPDRIRLGIGFNKDEYERDMGRRIHPDFYSFVDHTPRYAISTKLDSCSLPHLTKDTVKHSLIVKCKSYGGGFLHLEVGTDKAGYSEIELFSADELDFSSIDFANLVLDKDEYYSLPFSEKEKGWIEKQITVYSETYRAPFSISSLSYRYRVKGKIDRR